MVDDAVLNFGLGEGGVNRRVKPRQIVGVGNETFLYTPFFQAIENSCPELGALIFANPHPQDIFPAIQVDSNGDVQRFLRDLPFAADMIVNGIQKYHDVDGLQRPLLPLFGDGQNLVSDSANRAV